MAKDTCSEDIDENYSDASAEIDRLIINELLTSAKYAIDTGKTASDIAPTFALFYKDAVIKSAHETLGLYLGTQSNLNVRLPTRSRKIDKDDAKSTDLKNIVEAIRQIDWTGAKFPFVASDISQVCHVYGNLRDEVQMRSEMQRISNRLSNLEELLKSIPNIAQRIDAVMSTVKLTPPTTPSVVCSTDESNLQIPSTSYKDKLTAKALTPLQEPKDTQVHPKINKGPLLPPWQTVMSKRKSKKKDKCVVGMDESSDLLCSEVRPLKLFVTRCHAELKSEKLHDYLTKNRKLNIISIEKMKTRFDTYSSWKVVLNKMAHDRTEILKPENWPKNIIVRPFLQNRQHAGATNKNYQVRPTTVPLEPPSPSWRT